MSDKNSVIQAKKNLSGLIFDILTEKINVQDSIKFFPQDIEDESVECALHAILHFEADEDFRKYEPDYYEEQKDYLAYIAELFSRGEDLPANIIAEYKNYYEAAPSTGKKGIINMLKNLFRLTL